MKCRTQFQKPLPFNSSQLDIRNGTLGDPRACMTDNGLQWSRRVARRCRLHLLSSGKCIRHFPQCFPIEALQRSLWVSFDAVLHHQDVPRLLVDPLHSRSSRRQDSHSCRRRIVADGFNQAEKQPATARDGRNLSARQTSLTGSDSRRRDPCFHLGLSLTPRQRLFPIIVPGKTRRRYDHEQR